MQPDRTPQKEALKFRPVNKGLGFHPFSEGMPYAPTAPAGSQTASKPPSRKLSPPRADMLKPAAHKVAPVTTPAPAVEKPLGWGYLASRVIAFTVDTVLHASVCALALGLTVWKWMPVKGSLGHVFASHELVALSVMFLLGFSWALTTAQEIAFGTSLGKRMMGLRLEGSATAIFLRGFFFWVSACFLGLGLVAALFSRRRRCWHDAVVDIQPL